MDLSSSEVHTVGSLLKLYLRELPEPLFTFHLGPLFDEAVGESPGMLATHCVLVH